VLLVKRGNEPDRGRWSLPGGRVEPGEQPQDAVVREVLEETGLAVDVVELVGRVERPRPDGGCYDIHDYAVSIVGGTLSAGDDAADARWFTTGEVVDVDLSPGLLEALRAWDVVAGGPE